MSKLTSIWGTTLGAGGRPSRWKRPIVLLPTAIGLHPGEHVISTDGWLSAAVVNTLSFLGRNSGV